MPWSTALRMRCTSGSPISSITALSTRVSSPCSTSSTCLPCWRARSRTSRGKRSKTWRMGSIRTSMIVSCSWVETPATWWTGLEQLRPRAGHDVGDLARQLDELRAVDDQLADQVQQVVELREVDPHHARAGRGRGRRPPSALPASAGSGVAGGRRARAAPRPPSRQRAEGAPSRRERSRGSRARRAGRLDRPRAARSPPRAAGRARPGRGRAPRRGPGRRPPRGGGRSP